MKVDIFKALLKYQLYHNLPAWLSYATVDNGRIEPKRETGISLEEGGEENPYTKGFLVFENGENLIDRLKADRIVVDTVIPPWRDINGEEDFLNHISGIINETNGRKKRVRESAYVIDNKNGKITYVREFNNNIESLKDIVFAEYLPKNFLSQQIEIDVDDPIEGIGSKTRNGIRLALAYKNVSSYQVKRTPFANAGMGIVAEYGPDGLIRTAHMEHRPEEDLPYVNKEFQVVVIYRKFGRDEHGSNVCVHKEVVDMNKNEKYWFNK